MSETIISASCFWLLDD
uniref:Uncharacterized protein n=1 Tax=Arundo donax TaxID=35708 RepID=A0A0A9AVV0_ARUDO